MPRALDPDALIDNSLPEGMVVNRDWLAAHGFNRPRVDAYLRRGRLQAVGRGAYRRPGPPLKWEHLVYSLQVQGWPGHVGGRSALELQGYAHYLPLGGISRIHLYGAKTLPHWITKAETPLPIKLHPRQIFHQLPEESITTSPFGHWDWPIRYATPELALLEILSEVRSEEDFAFADKFFESASVLRPALLSALLRECTSIQIKRLFLWFAARHNHQWRERLELADINLGSGNRSVVAGGALDKQYLITVPRSMTDGSEQFF